MSRAAKAARAVAASARDRYYTEDETEAAIQGSLARAFEEFAELLDQAGPCGPRCPDGIACPLADDYPGAH